MNRHSIILIASLCLAGCQPPARGYYDQDVRREVFFQCLSSVPNGPLTTKYNDWSEVVAECGSQALNISARGFSDTKAKPEVLGEKR